MLESPDGKTECINDAQIKTRKSLYEAKKLVGSEKVPEIKKRRISAQKCPTETNRHTNQH